MKDFGKKLAQKRKDLGMTQNAFAERLSVTRQTVGRWEAGAALPDIDKIPDIAAVLGVSCDYLLNDAAAEESGAVCAPPVGLLLQEAKGRKLRLSFFDGEADMDLYNTDCVIEAFEGNWVKVSAQTRKGPVEKLLPLSAILSIAFVEEAE